MGGQAYVAPVVTDDNPFKEFKRKGFTEMRLYIKGEDLTDVSVSKEDNPETDMGYVARNPSNYKNSWYVAKAFAVANYDL